MNEKIPFEQLPNQVAHLTTEISALKALVLNQNLNPSKDQLLGVVECAELLKVSVPTIYGYTQRGSIPFNKKGKKLIFIKSEIIDWVKTGRSKSVEDIGKEVDTFLTKRGVKNE